MNCVLLIEDSQTTIVTVSRALQTEGFAVHAAETFLAIPRLINQHAPGIVILDLNMPVSGEDVGTFLKRSGYKGHIIIYSGEPRERLQATAKALRAYAAISKDEPLSELIETIKQLMPPQLDLLKMGALQ